MPKPFDELRNVYDVLEHVRLRPGMFVSNGSLDELALVLSGYGLALQVHGVDEGFDLGQVGPFAQWLSWTHGWSMVRGWTAAIEENCGDVPPLEAFFRLLDEWRASLASDQEAVSGP
ncbi:hypothetical protein ACFVH7_17920 [Kitasatospora indigofera]|uniref:hypothetical protein n=1 Tax=Kitasatospora indigofera TaxID=67307 RepID=UPI003645AB05